MSGPPFDTILLIGWITAGLEAAAAVCYTGKDSHLTGLEAARAPAAESSMQPSGTGVRRLVEAVLLVPPAVWVFGNLIATIVVAVVHGQSWMDPVIELPFADLAIQGLVGICLLVWRPRLFFQWTWALFAAFVVWASFVGWIRDGTVMAALLAASLLGSPLLSFSAAAWSQRASLRRAELLLVASVLIQIPLLILNAFNFATDGGGIAPVDRFVGSLIGRGGNFAAYTLMLGLLYASQKQRLKGWPFVGLLLAYLGFCSLTDFKQGPTMIVIAAGAYLAVRLLTGGRRIIIQPRTATVAMAVVICVGVVAGLAYNAPHDAILKQHDAVAQSSPATPADALTLPVTGNAQVSSNPCRTRAGRPWEVSVGPLVVNITQISPKVLAYREVLTGGVWREFGASPLIGLGPADGLTHAAYMRAQGDFARLSVQPTQNWARGWILCRASALTDVTSPTLQDPQSTVMGILLETGVFGLLLMLLSVAFLIRRLWQRFRPEVVVAIFAPLIVMSSIGGSLWEIPGISMLSAVCLFVVGGHQEKSSE